MRLFDRNFGTDVFEKIPQSPGIYLIYDRSQLIYVGKAKNLRRRLSQYRNAKRLKKHRKMREIVRNGDRIEWRVCTSELEACLMENDWIQRERPRFNLAGAFFFIYPLIGIHASQSLLEICYTAHPERFPDFSFHGAFRSRERTWECVLALKDLLRFVGHPVKKPDSRRPGGYVFTFRQLPPGYAESLARFMRGESNEAMEALVLALVENAGARKARHEVQEHLDALKRFWKHEAQALRRARTQAQYAPYPVPQADRDRVFLKARYQENS